MIARRRFIAVAGSAAALGGAAPARPAAVYRWQGTALGARASIRLAHHDHAAAARLVERCVAEIRRLEAIFSLYRRDSALRRLNRAGRLDAPPFELLELAGEAEALRRFTDGAFDVRVQPLWEAYAACARDGLDLDGAAARARLAEAQARTAGAIDAGPGSLRLERAGMALSFNGIAQGYITDRVAALLRAEDIGDLLLDLGEIRALGRHPSGRPWRAALGGEDGAGTVELRDRAVATSDPAGTRFDERGRHHHLFDPATGRAAAAGRAVSVVAPTATLADGLATAVAIRPALIARARRRAGVAVHLHPTG